MLKDKTLNPIKEVVNLTHLSVENFFTCPVYVIERPDFIDSVSKISEEYLCKAKEKQTINEIYPVVMSENFAYDKRIAPFAEFVGSTSWNIMDSQGYSMNDKAMVFTEMWTQEHHKHSAMEQHIHGGGAYIVGFYFLEAPENCSRVMFHDPRVGKTQIDLPQTDINKATIASQIINFQPKPGLLIFTNSWLAHSFSRHAADTPIKFIHFNLAVEYTAQQPQTYSDTKTNVEII